MEGGGTPSLPCWKCRGPEWGEGRVGVTPGDLDLRALKLEACSECRFLGLTQRSP